MTDPITAGQADLLDRIRVAIAARAATDTDWVRATTEEARADAGRAELAALATISELYDRLAWTYHVDSTDYMTARFASAAAASWGVRTAELTSDWATADRAVRDELHRALGGAR